MMAAAANVFPSASVGAPKLTKIAVFPGLRVLCWKNGNLYASRGYELLRGKVTREDSSLAWESAGVWRAGLVRRCTSRVRLASRLCRDGFHALAVLSSGHIVGAVPGKIILLAPAEPEFRASYKLLRGTRPLHITAGLNDHLVWGEYIDNPQRAEVHIYGSTDRGEHWDVAYTFPKGAIRHVHNIVYDKWENCLWVLTGDNGTECRIMRAACDFSNVEVVLSGKQQARCVGLIPTRDAIYFASDTPLEPNYVYRLNRRGNLTQVAKLNSSSISACRVGEALFFSTMVEPGEVNLEQNVWIYGSSDGTQFAPLLKWEKDRWPMGLFQYGNAVFPEGNNTSSVLAVTTVAVRGADSQTTLWRVIR